MNYVAIDVETALGKRWSICQIGLAFIENGEVTKSLSYYVQPPNNEYSFWNTKTHGITPKHTVNKPFFPEIWDKIEPLLINRKLLAHNAMFDMDCLYQTLNYYNLPVPELECNCTYRMTNMKLDTACIAYDIKLKKHHDAAADAIACAELFLKIQNKYIPDLKKTETINKAKGNQSLCGDDLKQDLTNADPNNPFYNKKVVFTGELQNLKRKDAAAIAKNMGANVNSSISKYTDIVVAGFAPGPSKMKKIHKLNDEGNNIEIMNEENFIKNCNLNN